MPAAAKKGKAVKEEAEVAASCGTYMFPNGDKYEGEFKKSDDGVLSRCGQGTHTTADGICYQGSWQNDRMNGQGRLQFPSGAVFEGEFVDNKFHGQGVYTWPNGSQYKGVYSENKMEGDGEFTDTDGQIWTGMFRYKAAPGLRFKLGL